MFDTNTYKLGSLCKRNHEYERTGKSLRYLTNHCVECSRERKREVYYTNPTVRQIAIERRAKLHRKNAEAEKEKDRAYKQANKELLREKARERYRANKVRYQEMSKAKRLENLEREREYDRNWKKKNRPNGRVYAREYYKRNTVKIALRVRLTKAFKMFARGKKYGSDKYGINYDAIVEHLGECPGKRSEWHIDHIRPLASFDWNDPEQIKQAFAPENHQWLPKTENLSKGKKYAIKGKD